MMMENGKKNDREEIKIVDRRKFTADGELRDGAATEEPEPVSAAEIEPEPRDSSPEEGAEDPGFEHKPLEEPEGVDFTILINAMATPAMMFLGEIPHPDGGEPQVDLEQARLQIDMLDLLRVKCRGNLTPTEEKLLEGVLYQLRMAYVAKSGRSV